jgi:hypothetical protein
MAEISNDELKFLQDQIKIKDFEKQIDTIKSDKELLIDNKKDEINQIIAEKDTEIQNIQKEIDKLK